MTQEELIRLESDRKKEGLSISQYSKKHNIVKAHYYYWKKKFAPSSNNFSGDFIPLDIYGSGSAKSTGHSSSIEIEMRTSSGAELRLKGSFTAQMLASIIQASGA